MTHIKRANLMLRISSVVYALLGLLMIGLVVLLNDGGEAGDSVGLYFIAIVCLGMVGAVEVVAAGLRNHKKWAWITALIIFIIYVPSAFIPMGIIGILALIKKDVREACGVEEAFQSWTGGEKKEEAGDEG